MADEISFGFCNSFTNLHPGWADTATNTQAAQSPARCLQFQPHLMSYDIFCYRSKLGTPDEDEASSVIDSDNDDWVKRDRDASGKLSLVKALQEHNPRLQAFDFDYGEIAKLTASTIEEAKNKFDHIELTPSEGDLAIQLTVFDNHVHINSPYWYQGDQAKKLFTEITSYIKVIRDTAGYYVYDPQTGEVFDPAKDSFDGLAKYLSVSEHMDEIVGNSVPSPSPKKKPWWKFW